MATARRRSRQRDSQEVIAAKRQTRADSLDYKKNRAAGDHAMAERAFSGVPELKHGFSGKETRSNGSFITAEKFGKKGAASSPGQGNESVKKIPNAKPKVIKKNYTPEQKQARETAAKETYENAKAWAKEEEKKNGKKRT